MKAIQVQQAGGPEVLVMAEIPRPEPGPGEVRVKIEAIGVNFIDIYHRRGLYPLPTPFTPGSEAAGVVDALGEGVDDIRVGDRVTYAMVRGSYADYAIVPAEKLALVPDDIDLQLAAAATLQGLTAQYLCTSTYPLGSEDTALLSAAAGGVGHLLVQVARHFGARVIGMTSTEEKAALARADGAGDVILYTKLDFEAETKRLTDGVGVDVVYESIGKETFDKSLNCLRPRGYMVLYGQSSGPVPPLNPQILNARGSLFLTRPSLGHYLRTREELRWRAEDLFNWISSGEVRVRVDQVYPLAEAAEAHRYLEGKQSKGKILLIP